MIPEFATLDECVRASFPVEATRTVAVHEHGDAAVALFDTRPTAGPYLYEVHYQRENGRWSEGSSSNGPGWHQLDADSEHGVVTAWGEAPPGADRVRAELMGRVLEEGVQAGVYCLVWWDVPDSQPEVRAFRVKTEWLALGEAWIRTRGS